MFAQGLRLLSFVGQCCEDRIYFYGRGTKLSNMWLELEEPDIISVLCQLAQLKSRMMLIHFPAGGSLYYTNHLEKVAGRMGIPLNEEHFCIGLDARLHVIQKE